MSCSIEGCSNRAVKRTWCQTHYTRWHRHGNPKITKIEMHGLTKTSEYKIWRQLRQRCYEANDKAYKDYGGRGIKVCERWSKFSNFLSDMGEKPQGHYIDRLDNDGDYSPDNCKWVTSKESANNRRTNILIERAGVTKTLAQWCDELGLKYDSIWTRIHKLHWDYERAFLTSVRKRG